MRRWIILAASLIVSGVFLWLALRGVPFTEVIDGIRQANLFWVIVSMLCILGAQGSRAIRWRGLLDNRVPLLRAFHILNLTMLLNQLPLRAGEVARSLLATRSGVPVVTAATSIVVERLIDVVVVVVMLAVALARLPSAPPRDGTGGDAVWRRGGDRLLRADRLRALSADRPSRAGVAGKRIFPRSSG